MKCCGHLGFFHNKRQTKNKSSVAGDASDRGLRGHQKEQTDGCSGWLVYPSRESFNIILDLILLRKMPVGSWNFKKKANPGDTRRQPETRKGPDFAAKMKPVRSGFKCMRRYSKRFFATASDTSTKFPCQRIHSLYEILNQACICAIFYHTNNQDVANVIFHPCTLRQDLIHESMGFSTVARWAQKTKLCRPDAPSPRGETASGRWVFGLARAKCARLEGCCINIEHVIDGIESFIL